MVLLFLLLFFAPFIPVLKHLPKWIPIYRIIWRDWYEKQERAVGRREEARGSSAEKKHLRPQGRRCINSPLK